MNTSSPKKFVVAKKDIKISDSTLIQKDDVGIITTEENTPFFIRLNTKSLILVLCFKTCIFKALWYSFGISMDNLVNVCILF